LFDIEVGKEACDKVQQIDTHWFDLTDKTYHEAWIKCPEYVLDSFRAMDEFKTEEAKEKFLKITGLEL
jgi:hypothetical protein